MASSGKLEAEIEVKSDAEKFWITIWDSANVFPKILPDSYIKVEILEGDGKSVGSVRQVSFGEGFGQLKTTKEKIESVDDATRTVTYSVIDGDVLKHYKYYKGYFSVAPKGDGDGSLVKWACEYEKASEEVPEPNSIKEFAIKTFLKVDDYIQKAS